jgi:hypothetical protein
MPPALGLNDRFVKLTPEPAYLARGCWYWRFEEEVRFVAPTIIESEEGKTFPTGTALAFQNLSDEHLRPIRDPGDDAIDEMLERVGMHVGMLGMRRD